MHWRLLRALILLPGSVMVLLPALILRRTRGTKYAARLCRPNDPLFWLALLLGGVGVGLMAWTVRLFATVGQGTPAPWEPPKRLVVRGPYRYMRNPMIAGGQLILTAETLLFRSVPLALLSAFFFLVNASTFRSSKKRGWKPASAGPTRHTKPMSPAGFRADSHGKAVNNQPQRI